MPPRAAGTGLLLAALGALQTLAFVHTWAWWLPLLCTAALAGAVADARPGRAALYGWLFGSAWLAAGTWWLFISLHRYGGLPAPLAVAAVALLSMALSLYLALAMALFARWRCGRLWIDAPLFALLWLLAELARTVIFTGFPWLASGYAQIDAPLAALAPWVGVSGIGAAGAALSLLLAAAWRARRQPRRALPSAALVALALLVPAWLGSAQFSQPNGRLTVSLLQTNVAQDQKFAADRMPAALAWLREALESARGQLVVAPETAIPLLPSQLAELLPGYWPALRARFEAGPQALLVGLPMGDYDSGYTNSVLGVSPATADAQPYRYDKVHLVPFGEFIPSGFRWFTQMMNIPLGDFARGPLNAPSFAVGAPARGAEHLLRRPVRRRAGAALRRCRAGADAVRQCQQHRLVRRHHRHRPASAHLAHAHARIPAADAARHQHRRHRRHRPPRQGGGDVAAVHARRARRRGRRARRHHTLRMVGRALWALAVAAAGRGGDRWGEAGAATARALVAASSGLRQRVAGPATVPGPASAAARRCRPA